MTLEALSDDDLLARTEAVHLEGQHWLARLLLHLVEIENRRLELRRAYSSLFDFCRRQLRMSDSEAYRRITATRLVRKFPPLIGFVERGETSLSTLVLLKHHLTSENFDELMAATAGRTKREVQALLAARAPKPDVSSTIRELSTEAPQPTFGIEGMPTPAPSPPDLPPRVEPLSASRHLVQFTVSTETRDKLERARDLLRHANPSGDLGVVVDRALTLLVAKLEKERMAKTDKPKTARAPAKRTRHIPADIAREVWERDGGRCTYVGPNGERCTATSWLEIEHKTPYALGGAHSLENLCLLCHAHNQLRREEVFGKQSAPHEERVDAMPPPAAADEASPPVIIADTRIESHRLDPEARAEALHGLADLGFRHREAGLALEQVDATHATGDPPLLLEVLRKAIRILTV